MKRSLNYMFFLAVLTAVLGGVSSDLYLPALPSIAHDLHASISLAQLTVAIFLLGFSLARLSIAIVSDAVGRKPPLLISLVICFCGCLLCFIAPNIYALLLGRLLLGYGAGGANILGRVILRDSVPENLLAKYISYFSMVGISLIAMAPLMGGYIVQYLGWRMCFVFLLIYTAAMFVVALFLIPETNKFKRHEFLRPRILKRNFMTLFANSSFVISILLLFFGFAVFMSWLTAGPIILQKIASLSPIDFGWCAALVGSGYLSAAFINSKLVYRLGVNKMRLLGACIIFAAGLFMLIPILFFHYISSAIIVAPAILALFGCGFVMPNSYTEGLLPFAKIAGIATAILGTVQMLGGFCASTIISIVPERNQLPLGLVIVSGGIICIFLLFILRLLKAKE